MKCGDFELYIIPEAADVPFDPDGCDPPFPATVLDVQEAICESRSSAVGKLMDFIFVTNGNTANKWLGWGNGSTSSDMVPLILPYGADLIGATFSNTDDDVDIDMEVYKNGTNPGDLVFTWEIRNKRNAWKTDIMVNNFTQGDRISVYLKKYLQGSGDTTAQDPTVELIFAVEPSQIGEGGQQNGD